MQGVISLGSQGLPRPYYLLANEHAKFLHGFASPLIHHDPGWWKEPSGVFATIPGWTGGRSGTLRPGYAHFGLFQDFNSNYNEQNIRFIACVRCNGDGSIFGVRVSQGFYGGWEGLRVVGVVLQGKSIWWTWVELVFCNSGWDGIVGEDHVTAKNVFSVTAILTLSCFSLLSLSLSSAAQSCWFVFFIDLVWVSYNGVRMYVSRSVSSNLSSTDLLHLIALKQQISNINFWQRLYSNAIMIKHFICCLSQFVIWTFKIKEHTFCTRKEPVRGKSTDRDVFSV